MAAQHFSRPWSALVLGVQGLVTWSTPVVLRIFQCHLQPCSGLRPCGTHIKRGSETLSRPCPVL